MGTNRRKAVKERIKRVKAEKKKHAQKVEDRLLGNKKVRPVPEPFFGGTTMQVPFMYSSSGNIPNNTPRPTPVRIGKI